MDRCSVHQSVGRCRETTPSLSDGLHLHKCFDVLIWFGEADEFISKALVLLKETDELVDIEKLD
jgi:hypothetical protein